MLAVIKSTPKIIRWNVKIVTKTAPHAPVQNSPNAQLVLKGNTNIKKILVTPLVLTVCSPIQQTSNASTVILHAQNAMASVAQVALSANLIFIIRSLERVNLMENVSPNVLLPSMEIPRLNAWKNAQQEPTTTMISEDVLVAVILVNLLMTSLNNVSKFAQMANSAIQTTTCAKSAPPIVPNALETIWPPALFVPRSTIVMIRIVLLPVIKLYSPVMSPENANPTWHIQWKNYRVLLQTLQTIMVLKQSSVKRPKFSEWNFQLK